MTNKEIRKRAWALFCAKYRKMLPAMAVIELFTIAPQLVGVLSATGNTNIVPVSTLLTILFAPVALCGAAAFALNMLGGGEPNTGLLFLHLKSPLRVMKIWRAAFVYYGLMLMMGLITAMMRSPFQMDDAGNGGVVTQMIVLLALAVVFGLVNVWVTLRLGLFFYAMAKAPEKRAFDWIRSSWRAMKRNCWRLIRLSISVSWPGFAIGIVTSMIVKQLGATGALDPKSALARLLPTAIMALFLCFYEGYPQLALAGFAEELLEE